MHSFASIFKLQLKNMLRRDRSRAGSRRWIAAAVGLVLLYALLVAVFVPVVYMMSESFALLGLQSEFVALVLLCGLMVVLIFGIVTVLTCLYFSKDTEFFLALPVRPSVVFGAKLAVVYLTELVTTVLIMLPLLIALGLGMELSALFYVLIPFAILLTPAIPLFFASIIAIPIMYLVSFFKNKGALGSILVIVLFGAFFALYYVGISKMQDLDPETVDLASVQNVFYKIACTVYPLYALARAMTLAPTFGLGGGASVAVNLLIYLAIVAAFGIVAFLISAAVYRRGAATQLEGAKRTKKTDVAYRSSGTLKALMKKEWREILRTPAFALNCLLGVVVTPILVGFVGFSMNASAIAENTAQAGDAIDLTIFYTVMRYACLWMIMFMAVGTNSGPPTAFSREGEKFCYCKILPIDYRTQIKAKAYVYMIICMLSSILGVTVMSILHFDLAFLICSLIFLLVYNFAAVHFGMLMDLRRPKLKWVTPNEVMKHNRNVMINVFVGMFVSCVLAVVGGVVHVMLYLYGHPSAAVAVSWLLLIIAAFVVAAVSAALLYGNPEKRFDAVEL